MRTTNTVSPIAILAAGTGIFAIYLLPIASPLHIGVMMTFFGINEAIAGQIVTIELFAMGIVCLISVPLLTRVRFNTLAATGGVVLITCNILTATVADSLLLFSILRGMAGAGAGLILASVNAMIARTSNPSSLYGKSTAIALVIAAIVVAIMPTAIDLHPFKGAYLLMAAAVLLALPLIFRLPNLNVKMDNDSEKAIHHPTSGFKLLAVTFIVNIAAVAFYTFIERMGARVGMELDAVALVLSINALAGLVASIAVGLIGERFGLVLPILISILSLAAVIAGAIFTDSYWVFAIGAVLQGFAIFMFYSYILGLAASMDKSGRWASTTAAVYFMSGSLGPVTGGILIVQYGYETLGTILLVCFLAALIILVENTKMSDINLSRST